MSLWLETTPTAIAMMPNGYIHFTITTKIGYQARVTPISATFQLRKTAANPVLLAAIPAAPTDVAYITNAALNVTGTAPSMQIEGYTSIATTGGANPVDLGAVIISNAAVSAWLETNIISRMRALQTESVVYKKIKIDLYYSKERALINDNGNLESLRQYQSYQMVCPPSLIGDIAQEGPPAAGAVAINQYPGVPAEDMAGLGRTRQQDKPGRFLVRGAAVTPADALRGTAVTALALALKNGTAIASGAEWEFRPVIDVMGDLWSVRSAQSAGYVSVAGRRSANPSTPAAVGGP